MSIPHFLSELEALGINIELVDENLKIKAPEGVLKPDLISELKSKKEEIIEFLKNRQKQDKSASIEPREEREYYPVSHAQRRLWVLCQFEEGLVAYNMPGAYILKGALNPGALGKTFRMLARRHESLRTVFITAAGELRQKILAKDEIDFTLEEMDLRKETDANREKRVKVLTHEESARVFNLVTGLLLSARLLRLRDETYLLLFNMHHIISDGWSMEVLIKEVCMFYNHALNGEKSGPSPLKIQYKDFSAWQDKQLQGEALIKHREYWLGQFRDVSGDSNVPVLELPCDYPRPKIKTYKGDRVSFSLPPGVRENIAQLANLRAASLFITLLASVKALLYRYTGQEDIVIGFPISGRQHSDLEGQIGFYVNTLALRTVFDGGDNFKSLLGKVKETSVAAYEHEFYPFDQLVEDLELERDTSRSPLFDVMVSLNMDIAGVGDIPPGGMEGVSIEAYQATSKISKFDLVFVLSELSEGINLTIEYNTDLFSGDRIQRMGSHYQQLIGAIVNNGRVPLNRLDYLADEEKRQLLYEFNDTKREYPGDKTIDELFEEQLERTTDQITLVSSRHSMFAVEREDSTGEPVQITYGELHEKSHRVAHLLQSRGVGADRIVGIMAEPSLEMIVGILGILKAGGSYLPVNPEYPENRKSYLIKDANIRELVTTSAAADAIRVNLDVEIIRLNDPGITQTRGGLTRTHSYKNLAYVIYTSGSTGTPKGVMVEHRSVVRLVKNSNFVELGEGQRILQTGALDFDASTFEIWGALLNGPRLFLVSKETILTPQRLKEAVHKNGITTMWMTAPLFNQMSDADVETFKGLRNLLVGGDVLSPPHINQVRKRFADLNVINGYGPTENTTFSTTYQLEPGKEYPEKIPIGQPIANSTAYIVNQNNHLVPMGVVGELVVGGNGLSRGYLNRPELTAEKFDHDLWDYQDYPLIKNYKLQNTNYKQITNKTVHEFPPIGATSNKKFLRGGARCFTGAVFSKSAPPGRRRQKIYKTGDLARWLSDGNIEFIGRIDNQVKIRGFRVEPGEIERRLLSCEFIKDAVVLARKAGEGDKCLCAYIVPGKEVNTSEVKDYLAKTLPDYMIPAYIAKIEYIPLTLNGKVDKNSLPLPEMMKTAPEYVGPQNSTQLKLVEIWSEILGVDKNKLSVTADFFELGGNSLRMMRLISNVTSKFNVNINFNDILDHSTVETLEAKINQQQTNQYEYIKPIPEQEYYEAFSGHERLYWLSVGNTAYHIRFAFEIKGEFEAKLLKTVFLTLIERHEILRTTFVRVNNQLKLKVHKTIDFEMEEIDLRGKKNKKNLASELLTDEGKPFDLTKGPLLRAKLLQMEEKLFILLFTISHMLTDGWGMEVLLKEIVTLYIAYSQGRGNPLPPLPLQYKDIVAWQNKQLKEGKLKKEQDYWLNRFKGKLSKLQLKTDYPRPSIRTYNGSCMSFTLDPRTAEGFKRLSEKFGATLYMTFLAIANVLLHRISGECEIIVGTAVALRDHKILDSQIGFFVNILALKNEIHREEPFGTLLQRVKTSTLEAFENKNYPFPQLVEDLNIPPDTGQHPLYDVVVALEVKDVAPAETMAPESNDNNINISYYPLKEVTYSKYDMMIFLDAAGQLRVDLIYNTDLFKETTIRKIKRQFNRLIKEVISDDNKRICDYKFKGESL